VLLITSLLRGLPSYRSQKRRSSKLALSAIRTGDDEFTVRVEVGAPVFLVSRQPDLAALGAPGMSAALLTRGFFLGYR
jgi:hypothetical protein